MSKLILTLCLFFASLNASSANYQFFGVPDGSSNPDAPVLAGTISVNGDSFVLSGRLGAGDVDAFHSTFGTVTLISEDQFFSYDGLVPYDFDNDAGGHGNEYWEYETTVRYIGGASIGELPMTALSYPAFGFPAVVHSGFVGITFSGRYLLDENYYECAYSYEDDSQDGTPAGGCSNSYTELGGIQQVDVEVEYSMDDGFGGQINHSETYAVTMTPVPVPAAAWLFMSSLLSLVGSNFARRGA